MSARKLILKSKWLKCHLSVELFANFEDRCQDGAACTAKLKCIYQLRKDLALERRGGISEYFKTQIKKDGF